MTVSISISSSISINPPPTEWDGCTILTTYGVGAFQSTHPARDGTGCSYQTVVSKSFQSTHPARGGTPKAANLNLII